MAAQSIKLAPRPPSVGQVTRDNVPVSVDAAMYFRVIDPEAASELLTRVTRTMPLHGH
jgi:regulator of protease activity HflC (stomatin/prohibitin superfamily)